MKADTADKLLALNRQFYQKNAESFSQSRHSPWKGWQTLLPLVRTLPTPLSVLDIGCGNGRFGFFLIDHHINLAHYTGIDNNHALLTKAQSLRSHVSATFLEQDAFTLHFPRDSFPLVVLFGVLHHVPDFNNRVALLNDAFALVPTGGFLIASFWQFFSDFKLRQKIVPWQTIGISPDSVETHDYALTWQQSDTPRYCHHFSHKEVQQIIPRLPGIVRADFEDDGKHTPLNRYIVWQR